MMETSEINIIERDYDEFKRKVLSVPGELERISKELQDISSRGDFLHQWTQYRDTYLKPKYGQSSYGFLMNILEGRLDMTTYLLDEDDKIQLEWFCYKNRHVVSRLNNSFINPLGLLDVDSSWDNEGHMLLTFNRVDGASFGLHVNLDDKFIMVEFLLAQMVETLDRLGATIEPDGLNLIVDLVESLSERIKRDES